MVAANNRQRGQGAGGTGGSAGRSKRSILKHRLLPFFGGKRLDVIQQREIETYKSAKLKVGSLPSR